MSVRKQDAYRALELLEQYYNRLDAPEDIPLKNAIDRVIKVFKGRLFQALLDIQEFYESILMNDEYDQPSKTSATDHLADEWGKQPMLNRHARNVIATTDEIPRTIAPIVTDNPLSRPTDTTTETKRQATLTPFARVAVKPTETSDRPEKTRMTPPTDVTRYNYDDHWEEFAIDLNREGTSGLGFSIAGGNDTPCINNSPAVVVTRITDDGPAARDGHLKLHDIILTMNERDFRDIPHQDAVNALKASGNKVHMLVRRLTPPIIQEIDLQKPPNINLGFSIAGGITHEHVKGDFGIFINNIVPGGIADKDGQLVIGDRLIAVKSAANIYDLEFVEHKHAVESIRRACNESQQITLIVAHPTGYAPRNQKQQSSISPSHQPVTTNQTNGYRASSQDDLGESSNERRVLIRRGLNGFGFHILNDENGQGIYISFIQSGGPADKSGELRKGDRILSVNDTDLRGASHEHAAEVLKTCGETANLLVINKSHDFARFENRNEERPNKMTKDSTGSTGSLRTTTKRQFFVRAQFDYDPSRDRNLPNAPGLAFRTGDILYVINAADDSWWQAKRVTDGKDNEEIGIIPSKSRWEKKERARQKRVNFNPGSSSRSNTLDREKKKKKKLGLFSKAGDKKEAQSGEDTEIETENAEPIPSYEMVTQHEIDYMRPVIIFGPFKEILNDQLLNERPDKFANCVPHTSRPKREKEIDGRDYYFVASREQMQEDIQNLAFIEAGEYGGNLYGTSISAVREVANTSKHCILDASGHSIRRLMLAGLYPIAVYVKARDAKWILDNMGEQADEARAQQIFEKCNKTEQQFGDNFTVTIEEDNLEEVYERICEVIDEEQNVPYVWMPSKDKI